VETVSSAETEDFFGDFGGEVEDIDIEIFDDADSEENVPSTPRMPSSSSPRNADARTSRNTCPDMSCPPFQMPPVALQFCDVRIWKGDLSTLVGNVQAPPVSVKLRSISAGPKHHCVTSIHVNVMTA
jgi:hypothetical protein